MMTTALHLMDISLKLKQIGSIEVKSIVCVVTDVVGEDDQGSCLPVRIV